MERQRIGIFFGGQSPEHEVSVITAMQVAAAFDPERYEPIGVYVGKDGRFHVGPDLLDVASYKDIPALLGRCEEVSLRPGAARTLVLSGIRPGRFGFGWFGSGFEQAIDVVFPAFHGGAGEAGGMQGICEMAGVPFVGSGVMASAVGMDKVHSKILCAAAGIPVVDGLELNELEWVGSEDELLDRCIHVVGFPAIVKPMRLGSSIGIAKVGSREELDAAIEEAFRYDSSILVEWCVPNLREINCSVLGDASECVVSVLEEPVAADALLSYQDKYMRSPGRGASKTREEGMASLDRIIPAPVSEDQAETIRRHAREVFRALDCSGLVRIDFLMDDATGQIWFNEVNTIPGSLSFYLWKPVGVEFPELVDRLITLAHTRHRRRNLRVRSYDVNLLAERSVSGLKGSQS